MYTAPWRSPPLLDYRAPHACAHVNPHNIFLTMFCPSSAHACWREEAGGTSANDRMGPSRRSEVGLA